MLVSPEGKSCSNCGTPLDGSNWAGGLDCTSCAPVVRLRNQLRKWKSRLPAPMQAEFERDFAAVAA